MNNVKSVKNAAETQAFARELCERFGPKACYALKGDLGAGKTCFVQGLAAAIGIQVAVCSPTFTIANEYFGEQDTRLIHIDLYRLSGPEDLESIGWDDYVDSGDAMAVEWPERAGDELPPRTVSLVFEIGPGEEERTITVIPPKGMTH